MDAETITKPPSAEEAEEMGFTIDRHTYPWTAYKGPRFAPTECLVIYTPAWPF